MAGTGVSVRISHRLLDRLDGKQPEHEKRNPEQSRQSERLSSDERAPSSAAQSGPTASMEGRRESNSASLNPSTTLPTPFSMATGIQEAPARAAPAPSQSRREGDLLVREQGEIERAKRLADELVDKSKHQPNEEPCQAERNRCLECYKANSSSPLRCKEAIDSFVRCARESALSLGSATSH